MSYIIRPPQGNMSYSQPPQTVALSTKTESGTLDGLPRFMDNIALTVAIVNVERPPQPALARPLSEALPPMAEFFASHPPTNADAPTHSSTLYHTLDILPQSVGPDTKSGWRVQVTRRGPYYDSSHVVDGYYEWTLKVWAVAPYSVALVRREKFGTALPTWPDDYHMPYHEQKDAGDVWGHSLEDVFALTQDMQGFRSTSVRDIIIDVDANIYRVANVGFTPVGNFLNTGEDNA